MGPPIRPEQDLVASYLKTYRPAPDTLHVQINIPTDRVVSGQAGPNNNPGNLEYRGQPGATPNGRFAKFDSANAGYMALVHQIQKDQDAGMPLGAFIAKFAPAFENNTAQYIAQAAAAMGADPGIPLKHLPVGELAKFMMKKESGTTMQELTPIGTKAAPNQGTVQMGQPPVPGMPPAAGGFKPGGAEF